MSQIKNENADMWDKKNHAIANAKEKATLRLAAKVLKPEVFEEVKERLEKEVVPYSSRYLISSTVKSHGVEESGDYKAYHAQVSFKYSLDNFRNLLKDKGFSVSDLQKHKVAAFIEVLDVSRVKSYRWWKDRSPKLHPVLKPLQVKLAESLKEKGYELIPVQIFKATNGFKDMASSMGAQYYINGSVKIEKSKSGYKVRGGIFNFHEALSQKLVSAVDLKKFGSQLQQKESRKREMASVKGEEPPKSKDLLKEAFMDAAQKMNASENVDHLTQGLAEISFEGVRSPVELQQIKSAVRANLKDKVSSFMERRIENGHVTFYARTALSPRRLLSVMNSRSSGLGSYRGVLQEDGKSLSFSSN